MRAGRRDGGQVTPLVAVLVLAAALAVVVLGQLGGRAVERAQARTAADAAALAGAADGHEAATAVARRNQAQLIAWNDDGTFVEVEVIVGDARAHARAERLRDRRGRLP
jgi:outer membrane lipoprotein SlyB